MAAEEIVQGVYGVSLGYVNAFLVVGEEGVGFVDCGVPKKRDALLRAVAGASRQPADVKHILITHHHYDHFGSLFDLQEATDARAYVHPADAPVVRGEQPHPKASKAGVWNLLGPILNRMAPDVTAGRVDVELTDGLELPVLGGVTAVHTPGHTPGHTCFLLAARKTLFVGDAAGHLFGLSRPMGAFTANPQQASESIGKIAGLEFDVACFGHGRPLKGEANLKFRRLAEKLAR
jgi:glyoxylase-like metal-dependent hydrolase (beta-lactamase superfamily II)